MLLKSKKHATDNVTLGLVRLFVPTAPCNLVIMGPELLLPIIRSFQNPPGTVLSDGEEEFSDGDGEGWKDR